MAFIKGILLKLFGKKLDGELAQHGISKTKVAMTLAVLLPALEKLSAVYGHPIVIPQGVKDALMAVGLWALKDGIDGPA